MGATGVRQRLAAGRARERFDRVLARLRVEQDAEIIAPEPTLFDRGCEFFIARRDKEWSLKDCMSFVVMRDRGLTADRYFEQAGFSVLLKP